MIFSSDLDRTLIYSKRAIDELGILDGMQLKPVEKKDDNWVAYMTETSFLVLKEIAKQSLFVPVTTRTRDQFNRFILFKEEIPLTYAVTSNGATILYKGEPLEEWSSHINRTLQNESVSQGELRGILKRNCFQFSGQMKQAENLFFYYILETIPDMSTREEIATLAAECGWRISMQGRKLYFIPRSINKGDALEFISKREGMDLMAGAGDSVLDWDFLKHCRYRFVPKHGELLAVAPHNPFSVTQSTGMAAGEEILKHFLELLPIKANPF